jgi:hypothetical protein
MSDPTHYYLHSAMQIGDTVRLAGSIVTADEFNELTSESREMLLRDAHAEPCSPPAATVAIPSPFPRKQTKKGWGADASGAADADDPDADPVPAKKPAKK